MSKKRIKGLVVDQNELKIRLKKPQHNKNILVIGDTHYPYSHPDSFKFLKAINKKYGIDMAIQAGDITDCHRNSRYDNDERLLSTKGELDAARKDIKKLAKIFPELIVVAGNHDLRILDRAKEVGLLEEMLIPLKELWHAPDTWKVVNSVRIIFENSFDRPDIAIMHDFKGRIYDIASKEQATSIQGDKHTFCGVAYNSTPISLLATAYTGCLVDFNSPSQEYMMKVRQRRVILGSLIVLNGRFPIPIPMVLNHKGRWTGELPDFKSSKRGWFK